MRVALSSKLETGLLRVVSELGEGKWRKTREANRALTDGWEYEKEALEKEVAVNGEAQEEVDESESRPKRMGFVESEAGIQPEESDGSGSAANEDEAPDEVSPSPWSGKWITRFGRRKTRSRKGEDLSILFVHPPDKPAEELWFFARTVRNIPGVEILSTDELEVYHVLKYRWLVMEGAAVDAIIRRKGHPSIDEEELGVDEASREVVPVPSKEGAETEKMKLPKQWVSRKWRHDTGEKSMRAVFGMNNATKMEQEAKKAMKVARRMKGLKIA